MENSSVRRIDYFGAIPNTLDLTVGAGERLLVRFLPKVAFSDARYRFHVGENASIEVVFADVIGHSGHFESEILLEGEGSSAQWFLSSFASSGDKKSFAPSVIHLAPNTTAKVESYGVATGESRLDFSGVSEIRKYARKSKTRQTAKVIVFDPKSDGRSAPMLKIGDNDVEASHAAVVGRLNEDHLYYLESRGIPRDEARRLIALGYLLPVASRFEERERKFIEETIMGGLFHD